MNYTQIIGHRGAPRLAHENTIASFQKALDLGVDWLETDVRKTRDGILVLFHDEEIGGKKIANLDFAEIIRLAEGQNFKVPNLQEFLGFVAGKTKVQIELKEQGCEFEVVDMALKYLKPEDFTIISFNFPSLKKIRQKYAQIKTGLIIGDRHGRVWQAIIFAFKRNKILPYVDAFSINWKLWISGFMNLIPQNYPVTVWTANESHLINSLLADKRVFAIASDLPDLALKLRACFKNNL